MKLDNTGINIRPLERLKIPIENFKK